MEKDQESYERDAYEWGFRVAADEIKTDTASYRQARERGIHIDNQDLRIEWDRGYADAICAYRLGHDLNMLVRSELYVPSTLSTAEVVFRLLDGNWKGARPDPRRGA